MGFYGMFFLKRVKSQSFSREWHQLQVFPRFVSNSDWLMALNLFDVIGEM